MSEMKKTGKAIRQEAKALIASDKMREKEARKKRISENKAKPFGMRWKAYWEEVAANRLVRKQRKEKIREFGGVEKKNQRKLVTTYDRIRYWWRGWATFAGIVILIVVGFNIASIIMYKVDAVGSLQVEAAKNVSRIKAQEVEGEGIVLLKNEDNFLPLKNKKINVFGSSSIQPAFGGGASGAVNGNYAIDFYQSLTYAGIDYNKNLYNLYGNFADYGKISQSGFKKPARPGGIPDNPAKPDQHVPTPPERIGCGQNSCRRPAGLQGLLQYCGCVHFPPR